MLEQQQYLESDTEENLLSGATAKTQRFTKTQIFVDQVFFDRAKEWYKIKYLAEWQFLCFIIIIFLILIPAGYTTYKVTAAYYKPQSVPFAIYFDNNVESYPNIRPIVEQKHETISISLARYILSQYVIMRESYTRELLQEKNWNTMFEHMQHLSSRRVFDDFVRFMDTRENPDSPVLQYHFAGDRKIKILSVVFDHQEKPTAATIYFNAIIKNNDQIRVEQKKALINFNISDIESKNRKKNKDENEPLFFMIMSYNIKSV
jgi:type IV secretory pathway component VirB8